MTVQNCPNMGRQLGRVLVLGAAIVLAACGGGSDAPPTAPPPPTAAITAQPTDQSAVAGTSAAFNVTAINATGYQWQRSNDAGASFADVTGATATRYTTAATTPADSGAQYRAVVSSAGGSVTSSAATLTVTAAAVAPAITVQPAPQIITAEQDASFSVTATGTALTYQWQRSMNGGATFTDEAGATAATLTLPAVGVAHNGHFLRVVVSNSLGSVTSTAALLTVNAATATAAFTQHPISQSVIAPQAATFHVAVSGTPPPTLQWQVNAGPGWDDIIGATAASFSTPATALSDNGKRYRVMATNVGATGTALITSNAATLTVGGAATAPALTQHPASITITEGQNAQFTVAASGSPSPAIQWQLSADNGTNWSNIIGATGMVFDVLGAVQANNGRQFRAVATNSAGSVNSNSATLNVNAAAKSWQPALRVGAAIGGDSYEPQVAFDALGNAVAVWQHVGAGGSRFDIWANRYLASSGWGTPQLIESDDSGSADKPRVGVDAAGNAVAVWEQRNPGGADSRVVANTFTAAGGWGAAQTISRAGIEAYAPQVAMSANGTALVAWGGFVGPSQSVLTARYAAGSWSAPTEVGVGAGGYAVATDANGNGLVAFLMFDGTRFNALAAACPGGVCAIAGLIETDNAGDASRISLAMNDSGAAVAVWEQRVGSRYDIWSNRYGPGSGWGAASLIETENILPYATPAYPQVGIDSSGNATAVWTLDTGPFVGIYSNTQTAGANWGTAREIQSRVTSFQFGINGAGNVLGMWQRAGILSANASYVTALSGWSSPVQQVSTTNVGGPPRITLDASGKAMAVWQQLDGGANVVWASVYK